MPLEASLARRLDAERRRGDLETELQLMQDDRARLAVELDGADPRSHRFEAATDDVGRRVQPAIGAVETCSRAPRPRQLAMSEEG